jgi:hypothetical protein
MTIEWQVGKRTMQVVRYQLMIILNIFKIKTKYLWQHRRICPSWLSLSPPFKIRLYGQYVYTGGRKSIGHLQIPWLDAQYFEAPILIGNTITVGVTPNSPIFAQY